MSFANSHPSYEIVGELTRFDERDSLFARERLIPGSAEEQGYYAAHPDLVKIDQQIRSFIERVSQIRTADSQQDAALYKCTFDPIAGLALPDIVDGTVAEGRALLEPAVMTARIKSIALRLGADDVRIGPLNCAWVYSYRGTPPFFPDYQANSPHFSGPPSHYRDMTSGDPIEISHPFAISMAFSQDSSLISTGGTPVSDFEVGRVYAKGALVATQLATYIRAFVPTICATTESSSFRWR